jgi:poly-gamma-glutamate synthesis protein (capsule biosynthesis protein)
MIPLENQITSQDGRIEIRPPAGPTARLAAFGDLAFHGPVLESVVLDSPHRVFDQVRDEFSGTDLVIGNLESVLVGNPYSPLGGRARLVSDLRVLQGLEAAGFDVLTLANNHILDAGPDGLRECLDGIAATGMLATGAGLNAADARKPASITAGLLSFKVFAYCYGAGQIAGKNRAGCNEALLDNILEDLADFTAHEDIPVVCLHMDAEFRPSPAPDRVALCRKLAENGVPLVICHHPHVVQGIEVHRGALIAYSLGNYVFSIQPYMRKNSVESHLSFLLEIDVDQEGPVSARIRPSAIDDRGFPYPAQGPERAEILAMIADRSRMLGSPEEVASSYFDMVETYTRGTFKNIYWAIGERDFARIGMLLKSLKVSRTKRNWIRHYLQMRLFGK